MKTNAHTRFRERLLQKEWSLKEQEKELQARAAALQEQLRPGNLLSGMFCALGKDALETSWVRDVLGAGIIYGADKWLFQQASPEFRSAGMFAVKKLVTNFIDPCNEKE